MANEICDRPITWRRVWVSSVVCAWLAGVAVASQASTSDVAAPLANPTTPGILTAYTTIVSAGFEWRIVGDDNRNCTVAADYRKLGDTVWKPAQPLLRVERGLWTHGEDPGNLLAGSLFFLQPGTSYQARLTLSDPDGGADQRTINFTTRNEPQATAARTLYVVPGSGGGSGSQANPFRGLASADVAALPGDLFLLQPGVYQGKFTVTRDGTAGNPIVYRGSSQALVVLDGLGGVDSTSHCIRLAHRQYVFVENLSMVNCLIPVNADTTVGVVVRGCYIRPVNRLVDINGIRAAISRDLFIADNVIQMTGLWADSGRTGTYGMGGYGILVEGTGHVICHNTIIEAWDAISMPVTDSGVPAIITSNVDVYDNFVDRASDDGIQADGAHHNIRIFRNRLLNTGSSVSFQPMFGGPGYLLFNEMYNNRIEPYKFHQETFYGWTQETSGFLSYHNTSVCNRHGWRETGIWRSAKFRNNLLLGGRSSVPTLDANNTYTGIDFDYDGYNRNHTTLIRYGGNHANLPAFYAATGNEQHGIEVTMGAFVSAVLPHHPEWDYPSGYGAPYGPGDNDLRLVAGSVAIDKGQALANINDGFTGAAPDLGCYEAGTAPPEYGPRIAVQVPTAVTSLGQRLAMQQNLPNPFSQTTAIRFTLAEAGPVSLSVYDVRGALVRRLIDGELPGGSHTVVWDGRGADGRRASSGIYFCSLVCDGHQLTRRMTRMR